MTHLPSYKYRAASRKKRSKELEEHEVRNTYEEARRDAWPLRETCKVVLLLRADTTGINAGKFFLHEIIK